MLFTIFKRYLLENGVNADHIIKIATEFYSVYDSDYDDAWDDYMIYGGLPQVAGFQSERRKADYLKKIFANLKYYFANPWLQY